MKSIVIFFLLCTVSSVCLAQSDPCWRDAYPHIPAQWVGSGSAIEAANPFQTVAGVTVELWAIPANYKDARRSVSESQTLPASLVETTQSDEHGYFEFKTFDRHKHFSPGRYEIRAHMFGRESAAAYTEVPGFPPQWFGRGIRVALSHDGQGCSRIYSAGLDDTDCGPLDCHSLPAGQAKIVFADGAPLTRTRLDFYQHFKGRKKDPEFSLTTDENGTITTPSTRGCFNIQSERGRSIVLCFTGKAASAPITITLPPQSN